MILRIGHSTTKPAAGQDAWAAFAKTQQNAHRFAGCISQPAHAALAGRLAKALAPEIFGPLPLEVVDTIGRHDAGWAESDLAALECTNRKQPESFLSYPSAGAVNTWRKSIREAESRSPLAGILTSRHFCLLAPRDNDSHHDNFVAEETARRRSHEAASPLQDDDLNRFTAALGFCDLLSLCLCSGLTGTVQMPLAHGAHPTSRHAAKVTVSLDRDAIRFSSPVMSPDTVLDVGGWTFPAPGALAGDRFQWTIV